MHALHVCILKHYKCSHRCTTHKSSQFLAIEWKITEHWDIQLHYSCGMLWISAGESPWDRNSFTQYTALVVIDHSPKLFTTDTNARAHTHTFTRSYGNLSWNILLILAPPESSAKFTFWPEPSICFSNSTPYFCTSLWVEKWYTISGYHYCSVYTFNNHS